MRTKLFNREAKKHLKKYPRKHRFVTYDKADTILLLFESDGQDDKLIKDMIRTLKKDKKKVTAYGFFNSKNPVIAHLDELRVFNKKNVSVFHKPNKDVLSGIKSTKFNLLIDLSVNTAIPLMYLSLYADADMKISSKITDLELFDFILDINQRKEKNLGVKNAVDEQFIFDEIFFYLKSIQTTD